MDVNRRTVLQSGAGIAVAGLAGCLGGSEPGEDPDGYAAFFSLWDWSQNIVGDHLRLENPVDTGEMGHGWEPDGDLTRNVASTDVFVYLDTPEFRWAQFLAQDLQSDYDGITVIDGLEGFGNDDVLPGRRPNDYLESFLEAVEQGDEEALRTDLGGPTDEPAGGEISGLFDPHIWVDPVYSQRAVRTIADGLGEMDPDNAEAYEANAAEYNERLAAVDDQFESMIDDAERRVGVLAGHDSFQYIEHRYGFRLKTPTGISPDAEPSQNDIADLIEFVNDNEIDVILYDKFESPNVAEAVVEGSNASEVAAVSPAEGTTEEWNEQGWDYIDQMEQLNIPNLRKALGAD